VLLLAGLYGLVTAMRSASQATTPVAAPKSKKPSKGSFMDRAEERFRQRRDGFGDDH
jgi:hypothetical protein